MGSLIVVGVVQVLKSQLWSVWRPWRLDSTLSSSLLSSPSSTGLTLNTFIFGQHGGVVVSIIASQQEGALLASLLY